MGMPVGIGRLTPEQVRHRAFSYKLIRKGSKGPVVEVTAVNHEENPTPYNNRGTYFEPNPSRSYSHECKWKFSNDNKGNIIHEEAVNKQKKTVSILMYSPATEDPIRNRDAVYLGPVSSAKKDLQLTKKETGMGEVVDYSQSNFFHT